MTPQPQPLTFELAFHGLLGCLDRDELLAMPGVLEVLKVAMAAEVNTMVAEELKYQAELAAGPPADETDPLPSILDDWASYSRPRSLGPLSQPGITGETVDPRETVLHFDI